VPGLACPFTCPFRASVPVIGACGEAAATCLKPEEMSRSVGSPVETNVKMVYYYYYLFWMPIRTRMGNIGAPVETHLAAAKK
jgi:hypothetical protein